MNNSGNNWKKIWENKKVDNLPNLQDDQLLETIIKLDGFDGGTGEINLNSWKTYLTWLEKQIELDSKDSIFEVGCGSGAFLYPFFQKNHKVSGIDYSSSLIESAQKIMGNMDFHVCEAKHINTDSKFDIVVANSIFFYFPDHAYSANVLEKMYEKSNRVIGIFDIPNLKLKEECENERRKVIENYDEKYKGLEHLYYEKKWFLDFAEEKNCDVIFLNQNIKGYGNNEYRFNCILKKKIIGSHIKRSFQ